MKFAMYQQGLKGSSKNPYNKKALIIGFQGFCKVVAG